MVGNVNNSVNIDSIWIYNSYHERKAVQKITTGTFDVTFQG